MNVVTLFFFFFNFNFITCPYTPGGDDVQPGSVLLPATRRGRYLANIVRRQAVDGTGIKFNKDADRINAESKKKVDVLSEELLPYIIAEQERRTTLYKRIMTAIQNGEKGVTIAEIRNKPPLLIRKGLLYRCPSNRAPKEPDGSGTLMCEDDTEPTQIMYDSCLSAEDKELYVAESKYFFCNRHRVEGPDLPRNGTTVIGCPPVERTSLNYTSGKCALEDSDDVVVHYRYYPDRTYKFVTELDPDREVCEHWNPCQVGYIYSLPSPDQALLANELWKDYKFDGDEIVPPIPEDSWEEYVPVSSINYTSSPRRINIPPDYEFVGIMKYNPISGRKTPLSKEEFTSKMDPSGNFTMVTVDISEWSSENEGEYLAHLKPKPTRRNSSLKVLFTKFLMLVRSSISLPCMTVDLLQGQQTNFMNIPYRCNRCRLINVMIRSIDGNFYNMDNSKYHTKETIDRYGKPQQSLEIKFEGMKPQDFGNYFCIIQNSDGIEERIKAVTVVFIKLVPIRESVQVGVHFDRTMKYSCDDCTLKDILCNGESVLSAGRISIISVSHMISLNFPRFESANACVYMGFFKELGKVFMKVLAVIDGVDLPKKGLKIPPPPQGEQFEEVVPYSCSDCTVEKVFVNGIKLGTDMISNGGPVAFYITTPTEIIIRITEFVSTYEGVYQAVFQIGGELVTKTILEIGDETGEPATTESPESTTPEDTDISTEHEGGSTTEGDSTTASASGSTEPSASSEEAPTTTETPPA